MPRVYMVYLCIRNFFFLSSCPSVVKIIYKLYTARTELKFEMRYYLYTLLNFEHRENTYIHDNLLPNKFRKYTKLV